MVIRFFRRYFQHQWHATPDMLEKLNLELKTDRALSAFAKPNERAKNKNLEERQRGGRSSIPNIEFTSSGPFQIILDWLSVQVCQIKLDGEIWTKQSSHQQRIVSNTAEYGSIWFAMESWALLSPEGTLIINTQDGLVRMHKSDRLHSTVCNLIAICCVSLHNHSTVQSFHERLHSVHDDIIDQIAKLDIGIKTKNALVQLLSSVQPVSITRGHGKLDHVNKTFTIEELNLHYPGCYRSNPWLDWLFRRPKIDLRPSIIQTPTLNTFNQSSWRDDHANEANSSTPRHWWHYLYTMNLPCIPNLDQIRAQLSYRAWWFVCSMLLIGLCAFMVFSHLLETTITLLLSHHAAILLLSIYFIAAIFSWEMTRHSAMEILQALPEEPLSEHAKSYVPSGTIGVPTNASSRSNCDDDEEVVIKFNSDLHNSHNRVNNL